MAEEAPPQERLLQTDFLSELGARAGQGSRFFFRTDYSRIMTRRGRLSPLHPQWRLLPDDSFPSSTLRFQAARPGLPFRCVAAGHRGSIQSDAPYE